MGHYDILAHVAPLATSRLTTAERRVKEADRFMQELQQEFHLVEVGALHGTTTLVHLMYLQGAIMKGTFIDHYPTESDLLVVLNQLPSAEVWKDYIDIQ